MTTLSTDLAAWLDASAIRLDTSNDDAAEVLPRLAAAGLFRIGVPVAQGGSGGDVNDAVTAIAAVSERSLAAGFVFWGHRSFIEYLLQSPNAALREKLLPDLLAGRRAGATGLSNAMKFLSGIEELQIRATPEAGGTLRIDGKLPWVTNLRRGGFDVAAAVSGDGHAPAFVAVLSSDDQGLARSDDLDLMAMRATSTAALQFDNVRIGADRILHHNASEWLPKVRPAFLAMQCAMSSGLARRALAEAGARLNLGRDVLARPVTELTAALRAAEAALRDGLGGHRFVAHPAQLFRLRIRLAEIAAEALQIELSASGGRAYLAGPGAGFQRRQREAAFLPIITPSIVQLKLALQVHEQPLAGEPAAISAIA
ncbi:MAG: acyl-CoA/acyl-ACP dehydrogenase [Xanthobacteraceae bacterium]|nr:acyl-CoA/acyl-ACP dehydrogenase [Xanthobacteraceae bacterium]